MDKRTPINLVLLVTLIATLACNSLAAETPTPLPTNTPVPTETPTLTPTATHTPTATPVPTDTVTPTRTFTPMPQPGDVLMSDTFDRASTNAWQVWSDAKSVSQVLGGVLSLEVREPNVFYHTYAGKRLGDVDMTFTATLAEGAAANTMFGGQCRGKDDNNFYYFAISGNGSYTIGKYVANQYTALVAWAASSAVHTGKTPNTLRIICAGEVLQFWVNGVRLATVHDDDLERGKIGFVTGTFDSSNPDSEVIFDDLSVVLPDVEALASSQTGNTGGNSSGGGSTPQPTVAGAATKPPATSGQGTLSITNNVSFGVQIIVWGPGDFRIDAPPNQTTTAQLPSGNYGWQVFANGCELYPTENLVVNSIAYISIEPYDNECKYQVYYSWP